MSRYFIEVNYRGTNYAGFQKQENAHTVQAEVEAALSKILRTGFQLTGSSRTDAGVHALQNYFHFDTELDLQDKLVYNLNAVLPGDLAVNRLIRMPATAHSRFDAISRSYRYHLYTKKDPFLQDRAYFFPYSLDYALMAEAAAILCGYSDFTSFSKRNTQVKTFICALSESRWDLNERGCAYVVTGNRFLRGMVRALTATMLRVGRGRMGIADFRRVIEARDCTQADFAVPAHGLFLERVDYPAGYFGIDAV